MTRTQQIIQKRLPTPLHKWLEAQQTNGASVRDIAAALEVKTDIPVSKSTIAKWLRDGVPRG